MDELRSKINMKISNLKNEYYSFYNKEKMSEDDNIIRDHIFREIELLEWVIEESYRIDKKPNINTLEKKQSKKLTIL